MIIYSLDILLFLFGTSLLFHVQFLISSASVRSILFLSFIVPISAWNDPLVSLIFLKRSLVYPSLLLSSVCLQWSLRKVFLSLLAILWNSAFRWRYLSFSPLPFSSLLFSATFKDSSDLHLLFCISSSWGWFWSLPSTMLQTFVHSSSGTLSDLIPWIYLSLPLYNHKGFDLGHTWMV